MTRVRFAIFVAFFILIRPVYGQQFWEWSPKADHHAAACTVRSSDSGGSGVYIKDGECTGVLTAKHVIHGLATCTFPNGEVVEGRCTVDRYGHDIGFVFCHIESVAPLAIAKEGPVINDWVEVLGFGGPAGNRLRHFSGRVINGPEGWGTFSQFYSQSVINGDSGAGILDRRHEVVGIQTNGENGMAGYVNEWPVYADSGGPNHSHIVDFIARIKAKG